MGGDCLATLTGNDSTRKAVKSAINRMERSWLSPYKLTIKKDTYRQNEYNILATGYYEDSDNLYELAVIECPMSTVYM